ncbi:mobilization protein, partial [Parabacteroides distasonis]|nr:mobilization protein [Parabacteroides distasonis]
MCEKNSFRNYPTIYPGALDKYKDAQNQLLQLQKNYVPLKQRRTSKKLISKASEKFYGLIGKTVNDREKDALKAKVKTLEGENEQLSDRLGKAILEKSETAQRHSKPRMTRSIIDNKWTTQGQPVTY